MNISSENYQLLQDANEALGEIYTKGKDSIVLVNVRQALQKIITDIHASIPININLEGNEIKEE